MPFLAPYRNIVKAKNANLERDNELRGLNLINLLVVILSVEEGISQSSCKSPFQTVHFFFYIFAQKTWNASTPGAGKVLSQTSVSKVLSGEI